MNVEHTIVMQPQRAPFIGWLLTLSGAAIAAAVFLSAMEEPAPPLSHNLFGLTLAWLFLSTGTLVREAKGGVWVSGQKTLHVQGPGDSLPVPASDIHCVQVVKRHSSRHEDAVLVWDVEVVLHNGAVVLIGESAGLADGEELVQTLSHLLRLSEASAQISPQDAPVEASPLALELRVSRGGAFSTPLLLAGVVALWIGLNLTFSTADAAAFLLGPPAGLAGLALLAALAVRSIGVSHLSWTPKETKVALTLGRFSLLQRSLDHATPHYARIRPSGGRGLGLELVSLDHCLPVCSAVTAQSSPVDYGALLEATAAFNERNTLPTFLSEDDSHDPALPDAPSEPGSGAQQ